MGCDGMKYTEISSKDNDIVKLVRALQTSAKARKTENLFVLEGLRICTDAYDNGIKFKYLLATKKIIEKSSSDIEKFYGVSEKIYIVSENVFEKMSDTVNPQGIIAVAIIPENTVNIDSKGKYIALENLNDPSNLGAVSRTAEALGVSGIIISRGSCDPYSPKSLRASMGTLLRMPLYFTDDITDFADKCGITTFACVVDSCAEDIKSCEFKSGCALIIGNEANGITDETKKKSKHLITIRMSGKAESLNAAAAASIAMWEMMK